MGNSGGAHSESESTSMISVALFLTNWVQWPQDSLTTSNSSSYSVLVEGTFKLTLGQLLEVLSPHQVQEVQSVKGKGF